MSTVWRPHRHDARIAALIQTPSGETPEHQRHRCAEYGRLVAERGRDLGHDAFAMAVDREAEPHWWRDLGFVLRPASEEQAP